MVFPLLPFISIVRFGMLWTSCAMVSSETLSQTTWKASFYSGTFAAGANLSDEERPEVFDWIQVYQLGCPLIRLLFFGPNHAFVEAHTWTGALTCQFLQRTDRNRCLLGNKSFHILVGSGTHGMCDVLADSHRSDRRRPKL